MAKARLCHMLRTQTVPLPRELEDRYESAIMRLWQMLEEVDDERRLVADISGYSLCNDDDVG